jgi:hypothetical protein
MQVYAFTLVTGILVGLIILVGYLYRVEKLGNNDSTLVLILGNVLSVWAGITTKIFRTEPYQIQQDGK